MKKLILSFFVLTTSTVFGQSISSELQAINEVLDAYHEAASRSDWDNYFALMSDDGVFLGTDVAERWPKEVFREYAGDRSLSLIHISEPTRPY